MPAKGGAIQERAPAWGITPVPERLRTLGGARERAAVEQPRSRLLVLVAGAFLVPALSLPRRCSRSSSARSSATRCSGSRRRSARTRACRRWSLLRAPLGRARLVPPDRAQRRCRTSAGRCSSCSSSRPPRSALRARAALGVEARSAAGGGDGPRAARADRLRPPLREARRALGRRSPRSPTSRGGRSRSRTSARSGTQPGKGGLSFWQGVDLVIAMHRLVARRSPPTTRASREDARAARSGSGASATSCRPSGCYRARRDPAALARASRTRPRVTGRRRRGGRNRVPRARRAQRSTRRRSRSRTSTRPRSRCRTSCRACSQRLLILAVAVVATGWRFVLDLGTATRASSTCSARSSCRSSACSSRTGFSPGDARPRFAGPDLRPGPDRRVARRLLPLPVARAGRAGSWIAPRRSHASRARAAIGGSLPSFAARLRRCRSALRLRVVRPLAVIGHLSRDVVAGGAPRDRRRAVVRGARAARARQQEAVVVAKCGEAERRAFRAALAALGLPVSLARGGETTAFSFSLRRRRAPRR